MTAVAFDTSLAVTSACVMRDDGRSFWSPSPPPERLLAPAAHSQELLPELDRLIGESETGWEDVETIAVGVGPGTFTGLRIGVSTARALGQALGVMLKPVSSLEALAEGLGKATKETDRPLLSLIDARRGQVFAALYRVSEPLEQIWEPMVLDPGDLLQRIRTLDPPPICAGDWALESLDDLEGVRAEVPSPESGLHAVSALHIHRLGTRLVGVSPSEVKPVYIRLPDAEINKQLHDGTRDR